MRLFLLCVAATLAMPAEARPREAKQRDPNRMICRTSDDLGSRLRQKKTCLTAQQWDQLEREQRNTVDRIQSFKPNNGS